ncbi:MAG: type II toxin-antitoxin system VapB family antitoxin [Nocardioides sp.]|uniref:type II toxin-antitoxin system VapB family antitoxin n=1 Tax=Nocardioides sp. TaxID=35761 RepID=UPI0039E2525D
MPILTKLFLNNTTQAVRLPKGVAFDESVTEVEVTVIGESRLITPVGRRADYFFDTPALVTDDYLRTRDQPAMQKRTWA